MIHVADTVTGTVLASYAYDSYGQLTQTQGTLTQPYAYTGREYDTLVINTYPARRFFLLTFHTGILKVCTLYPVLHRVKRTHMPENRPDPNRKPHKSEARMGGMVATAVLVFLALFTLFFVLG